MAKINILEDQNKMALWIICEAIGDQREEFKNEMKKDENGYHEISLFLNGKELDFERFLNALELAYHHSVKKTASEIVSSKYEDIIGEIYEIQEKLKSHKELFQDHPGIIEYTGYHNQLPPVGRASDLDCPDFVLTKIMRQHETDASIFAKSSGRREPEKKNTKDVNYMNFEEARGRALEEMKEREERVIKRFFFRISYKGVVGYDHRMGERIFTIWTNKPGILIGKGGENVSILKSILKEEFNIDYDVEFKEIKGKMLVII